MVGEIILEKPTNETYFKEKCYNFVEWFRYMIAMQSSEYVFRTNWIQVPISAQFPTKWDHDCSFEFIQPIYVAQYVPFQL